MRKKTLLIVLVLLMTGSGPFLGQQIGRPVEDYGYTVVAKPLIKYTQDEFERYTLVRDLWNESFEQTLTSPNHYWIGGALAETPTSVGLNNTLDAGFEELPSDGLNANTSMPQWFKYLDNSNLTIQAELDHTIKNDSQTSASIETRFTNTTNNFSWKTPTSIYSSCGYSTYPPSNTIDGSTSTYWRHSTTHRHYVVYDLGSEYLNRKIQVYSGSGGRLNDVYVYVSSNPSDFGSAVVSGWSPASSGWQSSPEFSKKGRYVKLDFWTSVGGSLDSNIFMEFQAYVSTIPSFHAGAGIKTVSDYFINESGILLSTSPTFTLSLFLDEATSGDGYAGAYYALADIEIRNASTIRHIVYVAPCTPVGTPSASHFTNTTNTKYIYGVVTLSQFDVWKKYSRNLKSDYESLWGACLSASIKSITLKGDLYQLLALSTSNPPRIRLNYDPVSLKQGSQEQLVNGGFESKGWSKVQQNKLQASVCTKVSSDKAEGTTSYSMNVTGDTNGGSGSGFNSTKHQAVGLDSSSFIRESSDANPFKLRAFIKVVEAVNVASTVYSYVGLRITFQNKSAPYNMLRLIYVVTVKGYPPPDTVGEKYIQLVSSAQAGIWYEIARNPVTDSGWSNVRVTEVAMIVAFYYGESYASTSNARIIVRFDYVRLIRIGQTTTTYVNNLERSTAYKRHGSWSLKLNATSLSTGFAEYECGAENTTNPYYLAFPRNFNLSTYFYVPTLTDSATIQFSLAIDDGPVYGSGYTYELMYYYGSEAGIAPMFAEEIPTHSKVVSPSISTGVWTHAVLNWTKDMPSAWPTISPRVEALGLRVWTSQGTPVNVYFDLVAFYGKWQGAKKVLRVEDSSEVSIRKLNVTEDWSIHGNVTDLGGYYPPDNNLSNVDGSPRIGSHSDFPALKSGPDSGYDILSEGLWLDDSQSSNHYVDNNVSNVDSRAGRGSHSDFSAQKNFDGVYDILSEQWMGPHVEVNDYVDSNSSNVDNKVGVGEHSNFAAMKQGPDSQFDVLWERNIYPPPNDVTDFVDNNSSNVDSQTGVGSHSDFPAVKTWPDGAYDTLTERNGAPPPVDYNHFASDNTTDVDNNGGIGWHSDFNAMKTGPNSIYDRLTENDTAPKVDINHYVDNNSSNVDGVTSIGSYSNFNAVKAGPDGTSCMWTEKNLAGGAFSWATPTAIQSSCGGNPEVLIDGSVTTDWWHLEKEYHWVVFDMGSVMNITRVRAYTAAYALVTIRVSVSNTTTFTDQDVVVESWDPVLGGWNDSPEFNRRGRYIRLDHIWNTFSSQQMKFAFYEFQAWSIANYRLDLEAQFTNLILNTTYVDLCIYVTNTTSEDLTVDYWDGSKWVNLFQDIFIGWNNASVKACASATFTCRFRDGTLTEDGVQDSWKIDALLIHSWTPAKYQLDLEVRFNDVVYTTTYAELCVYAGSVAGESLKVDVWVGSGWTNVLASVQVGWNNVSVKSYVTGPYVTMRFRDGGSTDATVCESWDVDVALIHAWTPFTYNYQVDLEFQFTGVDYFEVNNQLCIRTGNLGSENITVQVWSASSWTSLMTLKANSWNNASVSLQAATFTCRFIDGNRTSDTSANTWQVDSIALHSWTPNVVDYRLDLEVQFTGVNYTHENEVLAIYAGNLGNETISVDVWKGSWIPLFPSLSSGWNNVSVSQHLTEATFTIRFRDPAQNDTKRNSWQIDAVLLHLWTIGGYKLDLEEQFTDVTYNSDNITLAVYTRSMGSETLRVDIWYGNEWQSLFQSLPANQWSNISIADYVTTPTVTIRFRDANQNDDPAFDSWQIDAILIRLGTGERYKLDLEAQWTDINYYKHSGEVCIKTGALGNESLLIDYWNGLTWTNIAQLSPNAWNNVSVPLAGINFTLRFRDGQRIRDKVKNTWQVDALYLHVWQTEKSNPTIERATTTSANQWYYKWWGLRLTKAVNSTGSYEIHGNSTDEGMFTFLGSEWDDMALSSYEEYVKYNVTDFIKTEFHSTMEYENYLQVEYVILFAEPSGFFQFASESKATAANDQEKYGEEYWHYSMGKSYEESSTAIVLALG